MTRALKNRLKTLCVGFLKRDSEWAWTSCLTTSILKSPTLPNCEKTIVGSHPPRCMVCGVAGLANKCVSLPTARSPEVGASLSGMNIHQEAVVEDGENDGYGAIEAEFLYCFICWHQPGRVGQVGCGVSTAVILTAARHANYHPEVVCVEPYPTPFLAKADGESRIRLIREKAQKVGLEVLTDLQPNDFLFVDSTHTVKPGSEVNRIVMPRFSPG